MNAQPQNLDSEPLSPAFPALFNTAGEGLLRQSPATSAEPEDIIAKLGEIAKDLISCIRHSPSSRPTSQVPVGAATNR